MVQKPKRPPDAKPPRHLSLASRRWWGEIAQAYTLEGHHLRILTHAAESWDLAEKAREALEEHGLTFDDDKGKPRPRPEVQIVKDNRALFARLVRELGLDTDAAMPDPRMPRLAGTGR